MCRADSPGTSLSGEADFPFWTGALCELEPRSIPTLPTDRRFTGQRWEGDALAGLYDYNARFYDPGLGLFIQADTIVPEPGRPIALNRYAYGLNNPVKYRDPTGHWVETAWDLFNIGLDLKAIHDEGLNWKNGLALTVDVGAAILPIVPGGAGTVLRVGAHADDIADAARAAGAATDISRAVNQVDDATDAARVLAQATDARRVRVFRVEGHANARISVLVGGLVEISGNNMLFLNFGDEARALEFFEKRVSQGMDGVAIKSFEVPSDFLDYVRSIAVPEQLAREFPNAPIVVDVTKAADQYGLRPEQIEQLIQAIIQGTGQVGP